MALIRCPKCNQEISDEVKTCLNCGYAFTIEELLNIKINLIESINRKNKGKNDEFRNNKKNNDLKNNEESLNNKKNNDLHNNEELKLNIALKKYNSEEIFYKIVKENYSCIKTSIWLFTKNIDILKKSFENLQMKISMTDLLDISEYIIEIACKCKTIEEFDTILEGKEIKQLLEMYFYDENTKEIFEKVQTDNIVVYPNATIRKINTESLVKVYCNDFANETLKGITSYTNQISNVKTINDYAVWVSYTYTAFVNSLCALTGIIKVIFLSKYIQLIINNEEFMKIIKNGKNSHNIDINDLYNLYNEFYSDILPETLSVFNLELLINLSLKYNENDLKQTDEVFRLANINIENLIVNCNNNSFVYGFFVDIVDIPDFKDVIRNDAFESIIVEHIPYYLCNRVSLNECLNYLFEQEKIIKKINLYIKKKILLNQESQTKVKNFIEKYDEVQSGEEFERFLKELYENLGFNVELTPATGDQGADLIIERSNIKTAVQAKFYNSTVGNTAVQEVVGAIKYYNADRGIVVSNSTYTNSAINLAKANNIELVDGKSLLSIINTIL